MHEMFYDSGFNQDISQWDVSKVQDVYQMFGESLFNRDISPWNISTDPTQSK